MYKFISKLVENGILKHAKKSTLHRKNGIIICSCGDCDKAHELLDYEKSLQHEKAGNIRIHSLMLNGGALGIHPDSPLNENGKSAVLLSDIGGTMILKSITEVVLYGHYVCGAAKMHDLSLPEHFHWLAMAALQCKMAFPNITTVCHFHTECQSDTLYKTYLFDDETWLNNPKYNSNKMGASG